MGLSAGSKPVHALRYRSQPDKHDPEFGTVLKVLRSLGLKLHAKPV